MPLQTNVSKNYLFSSKIEKQIYDFSTTTEYFKVGDYPMFWEDLKRTNLNHSMSVLLGLAINMKGADFALLTSIVVFTC